MAESKIGAVLIRLLLGFSLLWLIFICLETGIMIGQEKWSDVVVDTVCAFTTIFSLLAFDTYHYNWILGNYGKD